MSDEVTSRVLASVARAKGLPVDQVTTAHSLESLGIDSLDALTLVFDLEEQFHISIPDDQARELRTVQDIVDGVRALVTAARDVANAPGS
jgi:acyl carrier protein